MTVLLLQVTVQAAVLLLRVAVILQAVGAMHWEAEGIRLEVAVTPCRQRSQAAVARGLEYLYFRVKWDMMSALRQISSDFTYLTRFTTESETVTPITQSSLEVRIYHCLM